MAPTGSLVSIIFRFKKTIIFFIILVCFFFVYNFILIDNTLEDLKFSLDQATAAYDIKDLDGLDILINQLMVKEIAQKKNNIASVGNLEYARSAINKGEGYLILDNVKVSLGAMIKERESKRNPFLRAVDYLNRGVKKEMSGSVKQLIKFFLPVKIEKMTGDTKMKYEKALELEKSGDYSQALIIFSAILLKDPSLEKAGVIKLRMANIHQVLGQLDKALSIYGEVVTKYAGSREAYIAQDILTGMQQVDGSSESPSILLAKLDQTSSDDIISMQDLLYRLGAAYLKLLNYQESRKCFDRAMKLDPGSEMSQKSYFNMAWVKKEEGKLTESLNDFSALCKLTKSPIAMDSYYQLADIYHKQGKFEKSVETFLRIADEHKGGAIASLCLFQAGASYMYDLNDTAKAQQIFSRLSKDYPESLFSEYLSPGNPVGLFVTYLVPRSMRVMAWRAGGLLALAGYSGEIVKFTIKVEEEAFNSTFSDWLSKELPDTVGNLYTDIKDTKVSFLEGGISGAGKITMGQITADGSAEGYVKAAGEGGIETMVTKAYLSGIPIPPSLINNTITGLGLIAKNSPIYLDSVSMEKKLLLFKGYSSLRFIERIAETLYKLSSGAEGISVEVDEMDKNEKKEVYGIFRKKFPENDFSASPSYDKGSLFTDFYTRMSFYIAFKLLETTKDSKLDYQRSVRTLGSIIVKKGRFRVTLKDADVTVAMNDWANKEFPWILSQEFLFSMQGIDIRFTDKGDIAFKCRLNLGRFRENDIMAVRVRGTAYYELDKESKIPALKLKEIYLNDESFPVDKLNQVADRCLMMLKSGRLPLELNVVEIKDGTLGMQGLGARDFTVRIFSSANLFDIYRVVGYDRVLAGIQHLNDIDKNNLVNKISYYKVAKTADKAVIQKSVSAMPGRKSARPEESRSVREDRARAKEAQLQAELEKALKEESEADKEPQEGAEWEGEVVQTDSFTDAQLSGLIKDFEAMQATDKAKIVTGALHQAGEQIKDTILTQGETAEQIKQITMQTGAGAGLRIPGAPVGKAGINKFEDRMKELESALNEKAAVQGRNNAAAKPDFRRSVSIEYKLGRQVVKVSGEYDVYIVDVPEKHSQVRNNSVYISVADVQRRMSSYAKQGLGQKDALEQAINQSVKYELIKNNEVVSSSKAAIARHTGGSPESISDDYALDWIMGKKAVEGLDPNAKIGTVTDRTGKPLTLTLSEKIFQDAGNTADLSVSGTTAENDKDNARNTSQALNDRAKSWIDAIREKIAEAMGKSKSRGVPKDKGGVAPKKKEKAVKKTAGSEKAKMNTKGSRDSGSKSIMPAAESRSATIQRSLDSIKSSLEDIEDELDLVE